MVLYTGKLSHKFKGTAIKKEILYCKDILYKKCTKNGTHGPIGPGAKRKKQGHGTVHCVIPAPVIGASIDPRSETPKGARGPGQKKPSPMQRGQTAYVRPAKE